MQFFKQPFLECKNKYVLFLFARCRTLEKTKESKTPCLLRSMKRIVINCLQPLCIVWLLELTHRLDGHQGTDTLNFVIANLFDSIATKLFENPENLEDEIKEIFQHVDSLYCEEKAEQLLSITNPKKSCIPCFSRSPDSHQEVMLDSLFRLQNLYLGCGCVLTLLCVYNNKLIVAGLGDCGVCFSIGGRSSYSLKRHDLNDASERQRIKVEMLSSVDLQDAGAQVEDNRINGMLEVSRSFGDVWFKQSYHQRRYEQAIEYD